MAERHVAALDVGGTEIKGALVTSGARMLERRRWPTPAGDGPDAVLAAVLDAAAELAAAGPVAIGVAVPGVVDEERDVVAYAANLGWRDVPLRAAVRERTGLPVGFGRDMRACGLAEVTHGAARGARDAAIIPIGTGIAAALISDGRYLSGGGYAGEIGHVDVGHGEPCPCGGRGCVEVVASAAAIARRYTARAGAPAEGAAGVARLVEAGDADARAVWAEAVEALAVGVVWLATALAPEVVVIGGGLSRAGETLLAPLREAVEARLTFQRRPRVVPAELGDEAGTLGAALFAWEASAE
jgi:glucokinase